MGSAAQNVESSGVVVRLARCRRFLEEGRQRIFGLSGAKVVSALDCSVPEH